MGARAIVLNRRDNFRMRHERGPGSESSSSDDSSSESSSDSSSCAAGDINLELVSSLGVQLEPPWLSSKGDRSEDGLAAAALGNDTSGYAPLPVGDSLGDGQWTPLPLPA